MTIARGVPTAIGAQAGMAMIEILGALALAAIMLLGLTTLISDSIEDAKGQQAALRQEQMVNAVNRYVAANFANLSSATASGTVIPVTVAQLRTGGFLQPGFSAINSYLQNSCALVRQVGTNRLDTLVLTYGGQPIPEGNLPLVAMLSGQGGGYISSAAPGTARGASWQMVTTNYRNVACDTVVVLNGSANNDGGHLVSNLFHNGPGQMSQDFLYRDAVPGRPELNRMNQPIAMAGAGLVVPGAACGTDAALGIDDVTRTVMVCARDGTWQGSTWKAPVVAFSDLPASGDVVGAVRMVTALRRAFTFAGAQGWRPLAVDQNGNMTIPRDLTVGRNVAITGDVAVTGSVRVAEDMVAARVRGESWVETDMLNIYGHATPGQRCNIPAVRPDGTPGAIWPLGSTLNDENGLLLNCAWPDEVFKYQNGTLTP